MRVLAIKGSYLIPNPNPFVGGMIEKEIRVSTGNYRPADGSLDWQPRVSDKSDLRFRTAIRFWWSQGRPSSGFGHIVLVNTDGRYDEFKIANYRGRLWEMREGGSFQNFEDMALVLRAYAIGVELSNERNVKIILGSASFLLQEPIQIHSHPNAGSGGSIGMAPPNEDLKGQRIPMVVGRVDQAPVELWDDDPSGGGIDYLIADNVGFPTDHYALVQSVKEGGKAINKGISAGQYQDILIGNKSDAPNGIKTNSQATLPLTVRCGHRGRNNITYRMTHFAEFETFGSRIRPSNYLYTNWADTTRYMDRVGDTNSVFCFVSGSLSTVFTVRMDPSKHDAMFTGPGTAPMRVRVYVRKAPGFSFGGRMRVNQVSNTGGTTTFGTYQDISGPGGRVYDYEFGSVAGTTYGLNFNFVRPVIGVDGAFIIEKIVVEQFGGAASTVNHVLPYVLCERGILPPTGGPDLERPIEHGPLGTHQVDIAKLDLIAQKETRNLGWHWSDNMTHEQFLDLICSSLDLVYWWRFDGVLTFEKVSLPSNDIDDAVLVIDDTNRTSEIRINFDQATNLSNYTLDARRFRPLTEAEVAEDLTPAQQDVVKRQWTRRATQITTLSVDYLKTVRSSNDRETAISIGSSASSALAISFHAQRRNVIVVDVITNRIDVEILQPMANVFIRSSIDRYFLGEGKMTRLLDIDFMKNKNVARLILWAPLDTGEKDKEEKK